MRLSDEVARRAEQAGTFTGQLVGKARDAACNLYSQYPGAWANAYPGDPVASFQRGFLNDLCRGKSNPAPPKTDYEGGQCPVVYNVTGFTRFKGAGNNVPFGTQVQGPLGAVGVRRNNINPAFQGYAIGTNGGSSFVFLSAQWDDASGNPYEAFEITSVSRVDGQPDTCGSPPPEWENPDAVPPPEAYEPPGGDITYDDGTKRPVNVRITPFFINGRLVVDVGGITVNFDLGGVTLKFPDGVAPADECPCEPDPRITSIADNVSDIRNKTNNIPGIKDRAEEINETTKEIKEETERILDEIEKLPKPIKPPDSPDYESEEKTPQAPKEEEGIERFKWLKVTLTKLPSKSKQILETNGQIVTYCGWVEWKAKGYGLPREQVQYPVSIFPVPEGVDGYAYTLTNGAEGYATVIKEKPPQST